MPKTTSFTKSCNKTVALRLAQAGIYVFPCHADPANKPKFKSPITEIIRSWSEQSTTDPALIEKWWARFPDAMPAIDLGKSGLLVLDGDQPKKPEEPNGVDA